MKDRNKLLRPWMALGLPILFLLAWGYARPALAQDVPRPSLAQPTTRPAAIDPRADEILRAAGQYLGQAKTLSFSAEIWEDAMVGQDRKVQRQRTVKVCVRRPDHVYAESYNERVGRALWYDGKTVTIYNRQKNFYGIMDAPDTIDKMIDLVTDKFGVNMPMSDLLVSNVRDELIAKVLRGDYLGRQSIGGARCHHLAFVQDAIDWELWVEDGAAPVVRKIVITHKNEDLAPQFSATLSDWKFDATLPDYAFIFRAPLGASRINVLPARLPASRDEAANPDNRPLPDEKRQPPSFQDKKD